MLGALESRAHGEAAGQESTGYGETCAALRGGDGHVNGTGPDSEEGARRPEDAFHALAHHLTPEFLKETWRQMNRKGAPGIDGETVLEFESELDRRVMDLVERLKAKRYKALPVRRVEIPKGDGRTGPLGIPTVGDRLLQRAVARILEAVYEPEFLAERSTASSRRISGDTSTISTTHGS
ncbi:MAG TPA: hypothetical protein GX507_07625 [Clostridia bacterium]|nr:hypothetical protein [Clostridia bacterium]